MADLCQLPHGQLPASERFESHYHVGHHPGQLLRCLSWQGRVPSHHELWTMPLRTARFRRAALSALTAVGVLARSACALMQGNSLTPVSPAGPAQSADAPLCFEESISGGQVGNVIVGSGELTPVLTGDTAGLVRVQHAHFRRPVAVAAKDQWVYVVDGDQKEVILYDRMSRRMQVLADLHGLEGADVADIFVNGDHSIYQDDRYGAKVL